ncbi:putative eukaryotic translation initiation factor 4h [Paragonimus heterotremus]|uniref:Putative eukaryotic translation initiation factor 4h n=1 Tax=Paragonimus heterotremus TaxID=100268 RepID=A0A8J4T3V6_9TREM|nr:putative eukaryotic translation initiation factor 4h [Paragonimus heterotremus]
MASRDDKYSVFVGNLPPNTIQAHFDHIFPDCKMTSVRLIRDKESDAFKGFAYVDFDDEESLQLALKTDGSIVQGYRLRVNLAQDRRGGRGGAPRGGPGRGVGNGFGRGGFNQPRGNQEVWSSRGRPSMGGGGRFIGGGPRGGGGRGGFGQRQSYHPPGLQHEPADNDRPNLADTSDANSNSSHEDRPRLKLKPRTAPIGEHDDRQLSERSKAIFGTGRPREASPVRETEESKPGPTSYSNAVKSS